MTWPALWLHDTLNEIGRVRAVRLDSDCTPEQLAKCKKTKQAVIARLESGRIKTSTRMLKRIARATKPTAEPA